MRKPTWNLIVLEIIIIQYLKLVSFKSGKESIIKEANEIFTQLYDK